MKPLVLRDYQIACIDAHYHYFKTTDGNPLFCVPTGGGKSLIISEFLKGIFGTWDGQKVLIITHVQELIAQNYEEFVNHGGILAPVGIYSAGLKRRDTQDCAIFAGIQSMYSRAKEFGKVDLILIDECHLVPKKGQGRYLQFIRECRAINPNVKVVGYTATPYRLDGGYLHKGEGRIFTDVAYEVHVETLIEGGYLAPLVAKHTHSAIDTSGVGSQTGDFKKRELEDAARATGCVAAAVYELVTRAKEEGRKHWLIFACGRAHAADVVEELEGHGVNTRLILGNTPKEERSQIISAAKNGLITALVNVGVLTTGFNWPRCDLLAVMRPTQSVSLYVQIMGRGMRTYPGKENCLVLDYGGNVMRHGPINRVRVKENKKGDSDEDEESGANARICPECDLIMNPEEKVCPACGYEFPIRIADHDDKASIEDPIDFSAPNFDTVPPISHRVDAWDFESHTKKGGGKTSMKVTYMCGLRWFSEWICLEHDGFAHAKAGKWWLEHGHLPIPASVDEAIDRAIIDDELKRPVMITVKEGGRDSFDRIISREFPIVMERHRVDHYKVLKVNPNASQREIQDAFNKAVLRYHPDKTPGDQFAESEFNKICLSMDVIGDPAKRAVYNSVRS